MVANKQTRIKQAKEYVKSNIWKQFWKQKLYELILIPLAILSLWKIPSWIGWGIIKLFNIDPATNKMFCETDLGLLSNSCIGINEYLVWAWGLVVILIIAAFIIINWIKAKDMVKDEARTKYNLYYNELEDE